ncbi:TPA: hypothetical protein KOX39_003396 [Clostridioides difficile]|nr:hypothetical protein [Clostridioides difficile]
MSSKSKKNIRNVSFAKYDTDITSYVDELEKGDTNFNFSKYVKELIRKDMNNTESNSVEVKYDSEEINALIDTVKDLIKNGVKVEGQEPKSKGTARQKSAINNILNMKKI